MINPEHRDPEQVMNILLVEVRALTAAIEGIKESFKEFKEERKQLFNDHIRDCKGDMGEVYGRMRKIEDIAAGCEARRKEDELRSKTEPHWHLTKATYWLVGVTGLLVVEVLMNIYRFFSGGGH